MAIHGATAGLGINGMPMVGGGFNGSFYSADCYALDLSWHSLPALKNTLYLAKFSPSPFGNRSYHIISSGGTSLREYFNDVRALTTQERWENLPGLPKALNAHCMLLVNSTLLMTIGGSNGKFLDNAYFFDASSSEQKWFPGPALKEARGLHACGRIRLRSHQFLAAVVWWIVWLAYDREFAPASTFSQNLPF